MTRYQLKINKVYQDYGEVIVSDNFETIMKELHNEWTHYTTFPQEHFEISIVKVNTMYLRPIFFYESKKIIKI